MSAHEQNFHGRRRKPPRHVPPPLTPEQMARAREEALQWRAALREDALRTPERPATVPPFPPSGTTDHDAGRVPQQGGRPEAARRAQFAAAITRAEFGRFYRRPEPAGPGGKAEKSGGSTSVGRLKGPGPTRR